MALHSVDVNEAIKETSLLDYCVCVEFNEKIYKFKITFEHMDIVDLIEDYISTLNRELFVLKSEDNLTNKVYGKKFFPYMGKYRLKGNLIKTDNYLEPPITGTLEILFSIYQTNTLKQSSFNYINRVYEMSKGKDEFTKRFFDKANIEVFDVYTLEEINTSLNLIDKLDVGIRLNDAYFTLKEWLYNAKECNKKIKNLDMTDKFLNAIENGTKKNKTYKKHN